MKLPIYMDHAATTPCDPRAVEAMLPYFTERFGNSGSRNHRFGWEAEDAIEEARARCAALIGADPKEIVFTSGSTEANNLAIKGGAEMYEKKPAGQSGLDLAIQADLSRRHAVIHRDGGAYVLDPLQETLLIEQIHDHENRRAAGTVPLLVMDMWEHAYYLQYRNQKEKWIVAFWELVNWGDVARRLENAVCVDLALEGPEKGAGQAAARRVRLAGR